MPEREAREPRDTDVVELLARVAAHQAFLVRLTAESKARATAVPRLASRGGDRDYRAEFAEFYAGWQLERRLRYVKRPWPLVGRPKLRRPRS